MKKVALIIAGLILLLFTAICPLPTMLAVPGLVWRIMIGLLGCFMISAGIRSSKVKSE